MLHLAANTDQITTKKETEDKFLVASQLKKK
jgi:hypothetical protein